MTPTALQIPPEKSEDALACLECMQLGLARDVSMEHSGNRWSISSAAGRIAFALPQGTVAQILEQIAEGGIQLSQLAPLLKCMDGSLLVEEQINRLWRGGLLAQSIRHAGRTIAALRSRGGIQLIPPGIDPKTQLTASKDACIRYGEGALIVESAACGDYVEVPYSGLEWLPLPVSDAMNCAEWGRAAGLPVAVMSALASWLIEIRVLTTSIDSDPSVDQSQGWSFADRMMHARSRRGRHIGGYGGTYRFVGKLQELPAVKEMPSAIEYPLPHPRLEEIIRRDPPFTEVMEIRHSTRHHSREPLTLEQLSEFLYRSCRITKRTIVENREFASRVYPSGGRSHELEIYPLINRCSGIESGLYHYNGSTHSLELVSGCGPLTEELIGDARQCATMSSEPHIVLLISARFMRVSWKYESLSYSLTLKHVGVLFQSMYLVATAMGLAACALGGGPSDFSRLIHTDFWQESTVGEFLLGQPELP